MASLMPVAKQQYFIPGTTIPLIGGKLYTYAAGTSTPKTTWQDAAGTTPNTNPITLDSTGSALIYWDGSYKIVLKDALGNTVYTVDNYNTDPNGFLRFFTSIGSSLIGFIQAGAGAIARTLQDKSRESISVLDFGAKGDGVTDDTAAIQAAANAAAGKSLYFPGTASSYLISSSIGLSSNTTVYGDGRGTVIKLASGDFTGLDASNKTNVIVRDLIILAGVAGTTAYIGAVRFNNSSKCKAINVECIGMSWSGILVTDSSQCLVDGCRFSGWLGTIQDSNDIGLYRSSNSNIVRGNACFGGGDHGIFIQDPYANTTPTGNLITGNVVGQHNAYGIVLYTALSTTNPYDSRTIISNNIVFDILGTSISGGSGAGIYVQAGGGAIVTGNNVGNCCRSTTNFETLGMGGIAVQIGETGTGLEVEILVSSNHVNASRGPCIYASASNRGIIIDSNTLKSTGIAAVRGEAIVVSNVQAASVTNNTIRHQNPAYAAVRVTAITSEYSYHNISGNTVACSGSAGGFVLNVVTGGLQQNVSMIGNRVFGALANPAYSISGVNNLKFIGNHGESTGIVFLLTNCLRTRLSTNRLFSGYSPFAIIFSGTNTGGICDETNDLAGIVENDAGNGMKISMCGTATPPYGTGLWDVGDTTINTAPAVGSPERWRCTVAGYPGTWSPINL